MPDGNLRTTPDHCKQMQHSTYKGCQRLSSHRNREYLYSVHAGRRPNVRFAPGLPYIIYMNVYFWSRRENLVILSRANKILAPNSDPDINEGPLGDRMPSGELPGVCINFLLIAVLALAQGSERDLKAIFKSSG